MKRPIALLLTVLLHATVVLPWPTAAEESEPAPQVAYAALGSPELIDNEPGTDPDALHLNCPGTYEGIGVMLNGGGLVTEVAKGWPAHRAGIRPGDTIENPWFVHPVDGYMEFDLIRDGQRTHMKLKTSRICFRDGPF